MNRRLLSATFFVALLPVQMAAAQVGDLTVNVPPQARPGVAIQVSVNFANNSGAEIENPHVYLTVELTTVPGGQCSPALRTVDVDVDPGGGASAAKSTVGSCAVKAAFDESQTYSALADGSNAAYPSIRITVRSQARAAALRISVTMANPLALGSPYATAGETVPMVWAPTPKPAPSATARSPRPTLSVVRSPSPSPTLVRSPSAGESAKSVSASPTGAEPQEGLPLWMIMLGSFGIMLLVAAALSVLVIRRESGHPRR